VGLLYSSAMQAHPAAAIFPLMSKVELQALADDIARNGQQVPIARLGDLVLDGRNRLAACKLAKVKPRFVQWKGKDPVAWVGTWDS
jgi:ParB-like chromosome segregation protein Spo0J